MIQASTSAALLKRSFDQARKSYRVLTLLLLLILAGVGTWKGKEAFAMMQAISANEGKVNELQFTLDRSQKEYTDSRTKYAADLTAVEEKLKKVLPIGESYTDFTRILDLYFERVFSPENPILASGLRYGKGKQIPQTSLSALPTSLTITSSKENFFKFLRYIEDSGSLESGIRLMDVESIRVNFSEEGVSFTVDLNTYFREGASSS